MNEASAPRYRPAETFIVFRLRANTGKIRDSVTWEVIMASGSIFFTVFSLSSSLSAGSSDEPVRVLRFHILKEEALEATRLKARQRQLDHMRLVRFQ